MRPFRPGAVSQTPSVSLIPLVPMTYVQTAPHRCCRITPQVRWPSGSLLKSFLPSGSLLSCREVQISLDSPAGSDTILLQRKDNSTGRKELRTGNPRGRVILFARLLACLFTETRSHSEVQAVHKCTVSSRMVSNSR